MALLCAQYQNSGVSQCDEIEQSPLTNYQFKIHSNFDTPLCVFRGFLCHTTFVSPGKAAFALRVHKMVSGLPTMGPFPPEPNTMRSLPTH